MKTKAKTITVKWMKESFNGKSIRVRYNKKMTFFPKKALVNWDDEKFWYYNEELEITVQLWYLKVIGEA